MPACVAWMVQAPSATSVAVVPDTMQTAGVDEKKLTVRPDDAVAVSVNGAVPSATFDSDPKVMVWFSGVT